MQRTMMLLSLLQTLWPFSALIPNKGWRKHKRKVEKRLKQERNGKPFKTHKDKVKLLLMYNTAKIVRNMVSLLAEYHKEQPELFGPRGGAGGAGGRGEVPQVVATAAEGGVQESAA